MNNKAVRVKRTTQHRLWDFKYTPEISDEIRRRIRLSIAAYVYECFGEEIMSDSEFDNLALKVDLSIDTNRPDLDVWFRKEFSPYTGQWIHNHPDKARIIEISKTILKKGKQ